MSPNALAWAALAGWPLVVLVTIATRRPTGRLARTVSWLMLLSLMFLPSNLVLKVPGIPELDKDRICVLSLAVALELFHRRPLGVAIRENLFPRLVLGLAIWGVYQTVLTNPDSLTYGPKVVPGLTAHDFPSLAVALLLDHYLPFAIGARIYRTRRDLQDLLEVMTACVLIYLPFCLVELRMSPQFNVWLYGYYPSDFLQEVRAGGYRPMVFMKHGLVVATFVFTGFLAALALRRIRARLDPTTGWRLGLSGGLLVLCKSLGPIVYGVVALVADRLLSGKRLARVLPVVSALVLAYPVMRAAGVFPTAQLVELAERASADRSQSLWYRFAQEEQLLAKVRQRPAYGWGGWNRNQVWSPWGQVVSVTDGYWIIILGVFGYVGFAAFFLLMLTPVLRFAWYQGKMARDARVLCGALALLVTVFTIDQLPNSLPGFMPITYAGALFTLSWRLAQPARARRRRGAEAAAGPVPVAAQPALPVPMRPLTGEPG